MNWKKWQRRWMNGEKEAEKNEKGTGKKDPFRVLFPIFLLAAVIFLIMPNNHIAKNEKGAQTSETESERSRNKTELADRQETLKKQLEEAFSHMKGVGKTEVVIIYADSGETAVLQDEQYTRSLTEEVDASGGNRRVEGEERNTDTVLGEDGNPYIIRETAPKVQGVLILAEGASSAVIKEQLIHAAQALLGIPVTNIHVAPYQK